MGDVFQENVEGFIQFLKAGERPAAIFECKLKFLMDRQGCDEIFGLWAGLT